MVDLENQDSIKRMLTGISAKKGRAVSESTRETYFIYIRRFCDFCGKTPDDLIDDRKKDWKSDDIFIRRRHEEKVKEFADYFRGEGYSSNTIATAVGAVKSLYSSNYHPMIQVNIPSGHPVREYKIPTKEELNQVIDSAMPWHAEFMTLTKDCGISLQDMLALKLGDGSPVYGSIKDQLKKGWVPIHLNITREKTRFKYHTFLGEDSYEMLNNTATLQNSSNKRIFPYADSTIQDAMKALGDKRGWTSFTPYSLRKWFRTQLTLSDMNEALIESMMGHSLGKVKEAYLVPPPQKLREIYEKHYPALKL
ncbi:site-specific integrase [Patescibacteria group bacterium]|uniref:Putative site-specific tyrosine recombinase n=1 Tax=viral metagenome TaxID=1070528 RepID=A0A6M3LVW9_9ZZZZ|nr:site-specific integrase [Patescibacteria group bacterium]